MPEHPLLLSERSGPPEELRRADSRYGQEVQRANHWRRSSDGKAHLYPPEEPEEATGQAMARRISTSGGKCSVGLDVEG